MRADVQLRRLARVNPLTPEFARATGEVTFVPLECVWPRGQADFTRRAEVENVANGYTRFRKGDVLLPKVTPTFQAGRATVATIDTSLGAASTEVHILRETARSSARYMAYLCQSRRFISEGETVVEGVGNLLRVPTDWVKAFRVPLLSRQRQEAIADFLDRETAQIDAMIEAQEELAALFVERGQAEIDNTFRAGPVTEVRRLGHLLTQNPRYGVLVPQYVDESDPDAVPFIRVGDLATLHSEPVLHHIAGRQAVEFQRTRLMGGEVLLGVVGKMGNSALVPHSLAGANVARAVAVLRCQTDVEARLVTLWLKSRQFLEQALLATSGDTIQPTLGMGDLSKFEVHWPTGDLASVLDGLSDDLASTKSALADCDGLITLLRERRAALITAAVTGRIDPTTGIERIDPTTEKEAS